MRACWRSRCATIAFAGGVECDPAASAYRDQALTPVTKDETGTLEIFNATDSDAAVEKARRQKPPLPAARRRHLIVPITAPAAASGASPAAGVAQIAAAVA